MRPKDGLVFFRRTTVLSPLPIRSPPDIATDPKPPILWVRGDSDQIVGDNSLFDMGTLGMMDLVPGWPGAEVYPPQPMVRQTRAVLEKYMAGGGSFQEVVIPETGHCPYIEKPDAFMDEFGPFLRTYS